MRSSHFSRDVQEFLSILARHKVHYLIVGGEAVIYYGYARLTGDIDIFYERSEENSRRLYDALKEFWGGVVPEVDEPAEFQKPGMILQYGRPPNRIDLINSIDGVGFEEAWASRLVEHIDFTEEKIPVYLIGLRELIRNKEATGRDKDRDDLQYLKKKLESSRP